MAILIIIIIGYLIINWGLIIASTKTMKKYINNHPTCINNNKISCYICNSNNIHIKYRGKFLFTRLNKHICTQCGKILYYSKDR